jgi:hypothetical protein
VVRILLADLTLFDLTTCGVSGNDNTERRSECLVSLLFNPVFVLFRDRLEEVGPVNTVSCVTVVCETSDLVSAVDSVSVMDSVAELEVLKVSTEAMVDNLCTPVVGGCRRGKGGSGFSGSFTGSSNLVLLDTDTWRGLCVGVSSSMESKSRAGESGGVRFRSRSRSPIKSNGDGEAALERIADSPLKASKMASFKGTFLADLGEVTLRVAGVLFRPAGEVGEFSTLGRASRLLGVLGDPSC